MSCYKTYVHLTGIYLTILYCNILCTLVNYTPPYNNKQYSFVTDMEIDLNHQEFGLHDSGH